MDRLDGRRLVSKGLSKSQGRYDHPKLEEIYKRSSLKK